MLKRITRPEAPPPWTLYDGLGAIMILFAAMILGSTAADIVFGSRIATALLGWSIGAFLATVVVLMTRLRTPESAAALRLSVEGGPRRLPIIFLFGFGMAVTIDLLSLVVTGDFWPVPELLGYFLVPEEGDLISLQPDLFAWVLALLFLVALQPVAEEIIFRGVLFPSLRTELGPLAGFFAVSVFHGAFHLVAYAPSPGSFSFLWYGFVVPTLEAMVITAVRADTGSTRAAIVAHAAFGLFAVLKAVFIAG